MRKQSVGKLKKKVETILDQMCKSAERLNAYNIKTFFFFFPCQFLVCSFVLLFVKWKVVFHARGDQFRRSSQN